MIEVINLSHTYPGAGRPAVKDISFTIPKGEIFGFLGPSGAGKSTVQNLLIKLLPLQKGEIKYNGKGLKDLGRDFFNRIGVSFEHPNLYLKLTGLENLKYFAGLFQGETEDPVKLLERVGLGEAKDKAAAEYSKGMKQRLVFARALLNKPEILFLDEPTSGLDPATAESIKEIIKERQRAGTTIFLTTHNMYLADDLCHKVAFLNNGEILALDIPRNLKMKYGNKSVKIEYRSNGHLQGELLFPENEKDRARIGELLASGQIETIHSQEATLEQIFIKLTGRGLV
ncbi:ATP-binding cassette domain-containing protein [Thermanaerosceptrum fracticalcis]|uniref:ATP-binding cassette domain-containing protein n=1 Tax=Thermanaerosceptrum fracticalcis TaxID=1712410 RepID=A0A7G6E528_THEFR|nr:ABC transporter ATP-binding protein [Thermanaerosceptrum fracticalcis]QNB47182.1 ATP-binding cassette domain-containing protein [Thermanaerosceptrum fracticalcis]